jgi:hypothetical protein
MRAVANAGRTGEIVLYTGNDDNIVVDLLTDFSFPTDHGQVCVHMAGGLLGHWGCWTQKAAIMLEEIKQARREKAVLRTLLNLAAQITDCNAAFFDAANQYAGALPGINEVLRRQGLLENNYVLNPNESLSPGQSNEIDRVYHAYPDLNDDEFVRENLSNWLD